MPIRLSCPHCNHLLSIPDQYAGAQGKCKFCGKPVVVPRPQSDLTEACGAQEGPGPRVSEGQRTEAQDVLAPRDSGIPAEQGPGVRGAASSPTPQTASVPDSGLRLFDARDPGSAGLTCFILTNLGAITAKEHGPLLAGPLGLSPADANMAIHKACGILYVPPSGSPEAVRGVLDGLEVAYRVRRVGDLAPLPDVRRARRLEWDDEVVQVFLDGSEGAAPLPWSGLVTIACGQVQEERTRTVVIENIADGFSHPSVMGTAAAYQDVRRVKLAPKSERVVERHQDWIADLVWLTPPARIRLVCGFVDFSVLGEHRAPQGLVNLRTMLRCLTSRRPGIQTNLTPEDLADDGRLNWRPPVFPDAKAFGATTHWLVNVDVTSTHEAPDEAR